MQEAFDLAKITIGTYVSLVVVGAILGIIIKWYFIKSAVKAGTKEALEEILEKWKSVNNTEYRNNM